MLTTRPELTPASRSVRQKQPSWPALDGVELGELLGSAEGDHGAGEEIELHGETDPETRAVLGSVLRQQRWARKNLRGSSRMSVNLRVA